MSESVIAKHFALHQAILGEFGAALPEGALVLDFGCGQGEMVAEYRRNGLAAFGCDPRIALETDTLRRLDAPAYRIPFADNSFTFVFSDQVMEHIPDHAAAVREIWRVLRPGGVSLHIFPSRWKPLESHVLTPFAGVLQNRAWLSLWARLGVRTEPQKGLTVKEIVARNREYLTTRTNYLTKKQLRRVFAEQFGAVTFAERELLKHTYGGARRLAGPAQRWPLIAALYSSFYSRVILVKKQV
jgi:SAM-dependent methyltransferase